jgi:hypothetical protein
MFFKEAFHFVTRDYPYWNRKNGIDHIFTFPHDFADCFTFRSNFTLQRRIVQKPFSIPFILRNSIKLTFLGNLTSPCFDNWNSIIIPPYVSNSLEMMKNSLNKHVKKKNLATFIGKSTWKPFNEYSNGIRQFIVKEFKNYTRFFINDGHHPEWIEKMNDSEFCLCPRGFSNFSPRIVESLFNGCIPVIIGENQRHAFDNLIDYNAFSVTIAREKLHLLKETLESINNDDKLKLIEEMYKIRNIFNYHDHSSTHNLYEYILKQLEIKLLSL